jgi:D-alanine-D-alanine ligase
VFILLHGRHGEDGTIQGLLELLGIPYQGSGVLGSALAMDKHMSKVIYRESGIDTPSWVCLYNPSELDVETALSVLGLPMIVKPCSQGSSIGVKLITSEADLEPAVSEAFNWDNRVILEEFINGREITAAVIGMDKLMALPIVEIIPGDVYEFFDYEAKYKPGATKEVCPADIPQELAKTAQEMAVRAHRALNLSGYSRTDMILSDPGRIYVIETNTIPGMTRTSLLPQAAKAAGIEFEQLLDMLIEFAMQKG